MEGRVARRAESSTAPCINSQRSGSTDSQETLYTLAAETGGKSFFDSNDIALGISQAQEAMGSYYMLGYYSTNNAADGKFRKISVKLNNPSWRRSWSIAKAITPTRSGAS